MTDPGEWVTAAVSGVLAVLAALASDPTGAVAVLVATVVEQAGTLFTITSIAGFTLAPSIPQLPKGLLTGAAVLFGLIFVLTLIDQFWDSFKERVL